MSIPLWFLDIDGVVNAVDDGRFGHLSETTARTMDTDWPIRFSPEVVTFINLVHRQRLAEVRWLTTWGQDARTSLAPAVGLDGFFAYDVSESTGWWKADIVVETIVDEGRSVVWTDDEIEPDDVDTLNAQETPPVIAIAPSSSRGLVSAELRRIHRFLTEVSPT